MEQCYRQLTLEERRTVFHLRAAKASVQAIADRLERHRSTIYRELARNTFQDADPYFNGYFPTVADDAAARKRQRLGKLHRDPKLSTYVIERLSEAWSLEQISWSSKPSRGCWVTRHPSACSVLQLQLSSASSCRRRPRSPGP